MLITLYEVVSTLNTYQFLQGTLHSFWSLLHAGAIAILLKHLIENCTYLTDMVIVDRCSSCCTLSQKPCAVFHALDTSDYSSALRKQRSVRMKANVICRMCTNSEAINSSGLRVLSLRYCVFGDGQSCYNKPRPLIRASKTIWLPLESHY